MMWTDTHVDDAESFQFTESARFVARTLRVKRLEAESPFVCS